MTFCYDVELYQPFLPVFSRLRRFIVSLSCFSSTASSLCFQSLPFRKLFCQKAMICLYYKINRGVSYLLNIIYIHPFIHPSSIAAYLMQGLRQPQPRTWDTTRVQNISAQFVYNPHDGADIRLRLTSKSCISAFPWFLYSQCCTDKVNTLVHISQRGCGCFEDRCPAASSDPDNVMRALVKISLLETPEEDDDETMVS